MKTKRMQILIDFKLLYLIKVNQTRLIILEDLFAKIINGWKLLIIFAKSSQYQTPPPQKGFWWVGQLSVPNFKKARGGQKKVPWGLKSSCQRCLPRRYYVPCQKRLCKIKYGFKGTLMQIRKSPYMFVFIQKQYPENSHS